MTNITLTIVARNLGPIAADGAIVSDTMPANITNVTWTCTAAGGASCTASGAGNIHDTLTAFPSGGVVTYTVHGTLMPWSYYKNTAEIIPPPAGADLDLSNNHATVERYMLLLMPIFKNYGP